MKEKTKRNLIHIAKIAGGGALVLAGAGIAAGGVYAGIQSGLLFLPFLSILAGATCMGLGIVLIMKETEKWREENHPTPMEEIDVNQINEVLDKLSSGQTITLVNASELTHSDKSKVNIIMAKPNFFSRHKFKKLNESAADVHHPDETPASPRCIR